jgi:hypothetical protein
MTLLLSIDPIRNDNKIALIGNPDSAAVVRGWVLAR